MNLKFKHMDAMNSLDELDTMHLAEQDAITLYGLYGPEKSVSCSVRHSLWIHKVVEIDTGEPYAFYGVAHHYKNVGIPWVLCSEKASQYPLQFARHSKTMIQEMLESRPILVNWCLPSFFRFLTWQGFKITKLVHTSIYDPKLKYSFVMKTKTGE